jgi:hypothetical protein
MAESPLYALLNEINKAATNGMPLLAIAMTVALPDVCVSLADANGRTNDKKYKKWCADNLGAEFDYVSPDDLYSMRCGVLHNGRFGDLKHSVSRVIFALPDNPNTYRNCTINDAYFYSVVEFCAHFTQAVFKWFEANRNDPNVQSNIERLMQYRDNGLPPYIQGMTVLA